MAEIIIKKGNILNSSCQTIVCPVNTQGVMGKGLALYMANMIHGLLPAYKKACADKALDIGKTWLYNVPGRFIERYKFTMVLCIATKKEWRYNSKMDYIDKSMEHLYNNYKEMGITSLAMPWIGCGAGGLSWKQVSPVVKHWVGKMDIDVEFWEP